MEKINGDYLVKLRGFMNAMHIFGHLFKAGILKKEEILKIQHNLQMKYGIKDNSLHVFK